MITEYKKDYIKIKELNIEIQTKIHYKGKSYDQLKKEFGEKYLEEHLPTYEELKTLRNLEHKGKYKLGLLNTYEFVKQEDLISKKKGYVVRFNTGFNGFELVTDGGPRVSYSELGVRFCRRIGDKLK